MLTTTLDDGTVVRVMKGEIPFEDGDLAGLRVGDVIVGYSLAPYSLWGHLRRKKYMVRRGADGELWLVHLRKGVEC